MFQGNFKGVARVFQGDASKFQGPLNQVSRGSQEGVKDVFRVFLGCFKDLSWKF